MEEKIKQDGKRTHPDTQTNIAMKKVKPERIIPTTSQTPMERRLEATKLVLEKVSSEGSKSFKEVPISEMNAFSYSSMSSKGFMIVPKFTKNRFYDLVGIDHEVYMKKIYHLDHENDTISWIAGGFRDATNFIFVYSDIVVGHHVGDTMANSLRVIPLSRGNYETIAYETFGNQYFFPVRFPHIETISIKLADETGDPIRFKGGRVYLSLKFRKKLI